MKKITIGTFLLLISFTSFCQNIPAAKPMTKADYLKKSKTQKILGFVFLGTGAITLISVSGGNTDLQNAGVLIVAGGVATLASIPLFISASKNKKRAQNAALSLKVEKIQTMQPVGSSYRSNPALSLRLNL